MQAKRAITKKNAQERIEHEACQLWGLRAGAEVEVRWFDDGSGLHQVFHHNPDGTMLWLDFDACREMCLQAFGGELEETDETIWTTDQLNKLWEDFKADFGLPKGAQCFADLTEKQQSRWGAAWTDWFDDGKILIIKPAKCKAEGG